jgi:hypothetical protein
MSLAPIAAQLHAPPLGGSERGLCTLADGLSLGLVCLESSHFDLAAKM